MASLRASVMVEVQPEVLRWARERARLEPEELARRVGLKVERVADWERSGRLSLAHLQRLAASTHTAFGYLFLPEPPEDRLPVGDFRRVRGIDAPTPSTDLLDTLYDCLRRQDWFREHLVEEGHEPLPFVGSSAVTQQPETVAAAIGATLHLDGRLRAARDAGEALRRFSGLADDAGILVIRSGIVGSNTHRPLTLPEFRGFALSDPIAPLVFINARDAKTGQLFTLAHELAHVWLGESGVSGAGAEPGAAGAVPTPDRTAGSEPFCNAVAAELLAPMAEFRREWRSEQDPLEEARRLGRIFHVSLQVILIRARNAGALEREEFTRLFAMAQSQAWTGPEAGGGEIYRTQRSRLGDRFMRAVIGAAREGRLSYSQAFGLLGIRSSRAFDGLARSLEAPD